MAIPTRPSTGAPIESTWGGAVHDQAFTPPGTVANSAVVTTGTANAKDPLTVGGPNLNAGDFLAPTDGLYLIIGRWILTPLGAGVWLQPNVQVDGVTLAPAGFSKADVNGSVVTREYVRRLTAGQRVSFWAFGGGSMSGAGVQVFAEVVRLGDSLT
jgi:hypothetical protein